MYVKIGAKTTQYKEIRNLSFAPEIDVIGDSVPINECDVEIKTDEKITVGQWMYLYDDLNQLWAKFWIIFADEVNEGFVQVKAQSPIGILDRYILPAVIYTNATGIQTALNTVFSRLSGISSYTLDPNLVSKSVKGYCPEQTARERLQWICYVTGAYVKQSFTNTIEIKELDTETVTEVPIEKTYWRPELEYSDYVTAINLTTYSFTQGTPSDDDEYVEVGGNKYIISSNIVTLSNPSAPSSAAPNEIDIEGIYIANSNNASEILDRLAIVYFARQELKADIINNREFQPAQKLSMHLDDGREAVGFIQSMDFSFGLQAKSTIAMVVSDIRELTWLVINYIYRNVVIAKRRYSFREGYEYQIENPFIDSTNVNDRLVYRPVNKYATGTIREGINYNNQTVAICLHMYYDEDLLEIISVSDIEYDSEDKELTIG